MLFFIFFIIVDDFIFAVADGETALHYAVRGGLVEMVQLLLANNADAEIKVALLAG